LAGGHNILPAEAGPLKSVYVGFLLCIQAQAPALETIAIGVFALVPPAFRPLLIRRPQRSG
jgi:hypothetical protein